MLVKELIEMLEGHDPRAEVLLATQPNYPLAKGVHGVASSEMVFSVPCEEHRVSCCVDCAEGGNIVWLTEAPLPAGLVAPYAPTKVWEASETVEV
jgi:hypothetical protein